MRSYDVVIVGSGIIGLMTAYKLAHYNVSVLVLEKNLSS
ncbi:MAG: FAD-dependent oxidoreductase [Infirmifilum sp.]